MANFIPGNVLARLRALSPLAPVPVQDGQQRHPHRQDQPQHSGAYNADGSYDPSPLDITVVRIMLVRSKRLPPDLVDGIFEMAEYWVRTATAVDYTTEVGRYMSVRGGGNPEDEFLLRSLPIGLISEHGGDLDLTGEPAKPILLKNAMDPKSIARLADYPTPRLVSPVRKIVFKILAHDQGWGGEGGDNEYDNSWTWFEAGLERFEAGMIEGQPGEAVSLKYDALRPVYPDLGTPEAKQAGRSRNAEAEGFDEFVQQLSQLNTNSGNGSGAHAQNTAATDASGSGNNEQAPESQYGHTLQAHPAWCVHRNKRANREWQQHIVVWSCDDDIKEDSDGGKALAEEGRGRATGNGEFVRNLKLGDVVTLWAKARFGGWANSVKSASIDVYWAV